MINKKNKTHVYPLPKAFSVLIYDDHDHVPRCKSYSSKRSRIEQTIPIIDI